MDELVLRDRDTNGDETLDERLYALQDANYNVTAVTDAAGAVVERFGYDAYGRAEVMDGSWGSRSASAYDWEVRYAGYRWDSESGLYQVRFRYLHPGLGRWVGRDPLGYVDGMGLYEYVRSMPTYWIDPFGLEGWDIGISFPEDTVTYLGTWYTGWTSNGHVAINPNDPDWDGATERLKDILGDTGCIRRLTFAGHGNNQRIGGITADQLKDPESGASSFLSFLATRWCDENEGAEVRSCKTAQGELGKEFISELARILQANVTGYTDTYAIRPYGEQWVARPDGTVERVADRGPYYGSLMWQLWSNEGHQHWKQSEANYRRRVPFNERVHRP